MGDQVCYCENTKNFYITQISPVEFLSIFATRVAGSDDETMQHSWDTLRNTYNDICSSTLMWVKASTQVRYFAWTLKKLHYYNHHILVTCFALNELHIFISYINILPIFHKSHFTILIIFSTNNDNWHACRQLEI